MNTITLKSKQSTNTLYEYIRRMIIQTLNDVEMFDEAYEISKLNVIYNKGYYLTQFEAKGQKFECEFTTDQIQSFVIEELNEDIHSAAVSTGWRS